MKEYTIPEEKVICYTTDNGSNFVKAFREFYVDLDDSDQEDDDSTHVVQIDLHELLNSRNLPQTDGTHLDSVSSAGPNNSELDGDGAQLLERDDNDESNSEDETEEGPVVLPAHQRCASQTLNLLGSNVPTVTAKVNAKYRSLLHSSNGKLLVIWNKLNKQQSNEILSDILGCQLLTPVATRWNSYYDARRSFLLHSSDKLEALCKAFDVPCFKEQEFAFLKEENRVLTPLAESLDRLEGHTNPESYMGFLYRPLFQLRHQYSKLTAD